MPAPRTSSRRRPGPGRRTRRRSWLWRYRRLLLLAGILLTTASHRGMQPEDRAYLVRLTTAYTGLAQPDAERRVDEVAARAKEDISRARRSAVILAFTAGAAALLGAAVAWFAACAGGRVRDGEAPPHALFDWDDRSRGSER